MKAAKEKASYLFEAIGEKVGKPLYIQERESYVPDANQIRIRGVSNLRISEPEAEAEILPEISFRKIKLKYKVFARFAINQQN